MPSTRRRFRYWAAELMLRVSSARSRSRARVILVIIAAVVFILGWWGWWASEGSTVSQPLDVWTTTYRTIALFLFDGSSSDPGVPWQLQVARFLAPIVFAASAIAFLVATARSWAVAVAARWSTDHRIVVGTVDLDGSELLNSSNGCGSAPLPVHVVDTASDIDRCSDSHLHVLRGDGWPKAAGADRAAEILLCTPNDSRNLEDFSAVTSYRSAAPSDSHSARARILVSISDHTEAVDTAILLARRTVIAAPPDRADVIDTSFDLAAAVAAFLAAEPEDGGSAPQCVLIGGSRSFATTLHCAVEALWDPFNRADAVEPSRLWVVGTNVPSYSTAWCDVSTAEDLQALERSVGAGARLRIAVIDDDPDVAVEYALAAAAQFPFAEVRCDHELGSFGPAGLRGFELRSHPPQGLLERCAQLIAAPSNSAPSSFDLDDQQVRHLLHQLAREQAVVALERASGCLREFFLPTSISSQDAAVRQLPGRLAQLGIAVVQRPMRPIPTFRHLHPDHVEMLARRVHEDYVAAERAKGSFDPGRDTHQDWDDLSPDEKAPSRAQVLGFPELLSMIGYELVASHEADGRAVSEIDEDLVGAAGRREHDRWAEHKSRTRPDHPDLVPWDDLSDETKDKDCAPVRKLPATVAAAGLVVVRRSDRAQSLPPFTR